MWNVSSLLQVVQCPTGDILCFPEQRPNLSLLEHGPGRVWCRRYSASNGRAGRYVQFYLLTLCRWVVTGGCPRRAGGLFIKIQVCGTVPCSVLFLSVPFSFFCSCSCSCSYAMFRNCSGTFEEFWCRFSEQNSAKQELIRCSRTVPICSIWVSRHFYHF